VQTAAAHWAARTRPWRSARWTRTWACLSAVVTAIRVHHSECRSIWLYHHFCACSS
jgi:hypothetical protein